MSTKLQRIPLAWPIGARSGTNLSKDPYIFNMMLEKYGDKFWVVKRPGSESYLTLGPGTGTNQGIAYYNGLFFGVVDDVLYRQSATIFVGADGTSWQSSGTPQWPATQAMGACVFKNRMFILSGISSQAGIWSTVDGVSWVVNSSNAPWGFRSHPGVAVFKEQMFVIGGASVPGTVLNDVWSSPDGTNWTELVPNGTAGMWTERTAHCCIAANNGIYIYGGVDGLGTTSYNDVWYTADGVTWKEVNTAAPWAARYGAACFWFNNNMWIVGGWDGTTAYNDAWYSPDGITWTQATGAAFASGRYFGYFCVYRGYMWFIGGIDAGGSRLQDVYQTVDGATWALVTSLPIGMQPRADGACLVFAVPPVASTFGYQSIYLLGGDNGVTTLNEQLYGTLNIDLPLSFSLAPDVTGQPYDFTTYLNGQVLVVKNSSNMWILQSGQLTKVTDLNYPEETVRGVVGLNAFLYVMRPNGEIHNCKFENPFEWPALDFITADYSDDPAIRIAKHLNYVVALSQYSTQFFYDNGAQQPEGSPLAVVINANNNIGCLAGQSAAVVDNSLFFVGLTRGGGRQVYRMDGYQIKQISTPYVDKILMSTQMAYMQGINYSLLGHQFYVVKTGTASALVYDTEFGEWYEWDKFPYSEALDNGNDAGIFLWANEDGLLLLTTPLDYTDAIDGDYTCRCQTDRLDFGNTALKFYGRATLVGDTSDATPSITFSDDDYVTTIDAGTVNMTSNRPNVRRLGSARRRSWRPVQTDANPARWEAIEIEYSQGES